MKKFNKLISIGAICAFSIFASSCMLNRAASAEVKNSLTVTGTGSVTLEPDMISLKFLVKNTGWNIPQVAERNATNTENTIKAIKEAGIPDSDISTCDYEITQDNTHSYAGEYTAKNTITVLVRNIDVTTKVIDAAVKNNIGANGIISFEYLVSDKANALKEARLLAVTNAQDAAALIAGATGCKVNSVLEIKEDYSTQKTTVEGLYENVYQTSSSNLKSLSSPIKNGTITISSNVTIKYELIN